MLHGNSLIISKLTQLWFYTWSIAKWETIYRAFDNKYMTWTSVKFLQIW